MEIIVFGAGSLGSLLGGLLARAHRVTLVDRESHVTAVAASGLDISGAVSETVEPAATTEVPDSADLALVTVKAFDTAAAGRALAGVDLEAVLSLQNGMGNEAQLADHVACPVLAGTCTYGALLESPGHVVCTGVGDVVLGPPAGGESALAQAVGTAFREADIHTEVATDMPRRLWEKLAVNAGINATTALAGVDNGALAAGPGRTTAREAARETARVASANGVELSAAAAIDALERVIDATSSNTSSMRQDVQNERRTEIDAINGYVVDQAVDPVPVNRTLASLIRAWEQPRGLR